MENAYTKDPVIPFWHWLGRYITLIKMEMGDASTQRSWDPPRNHSLQRSMEGSSSMDPGILHTPHRDTAAGHSAGVTLFVTLRAEPGAPTPLMFPDPWVRQGYWMTV